MENKSSKRNYAFDFFRAYGCLAVIMLHVISAWRDDPLYGNHFQSTGGARMFFNNGIVPLFVRQAVPIFFMMSGSLFLDTKKEISEHTIFRHIKKLLIVLFIFGYAFCLMELAVSNKSFDVSYLFTGFLNLLQEETWSHLWYLYATVGLYIVTPILRAWIHTVDKKEFLHWMLIFALLFTIVPTINDLFDLKISSFGLNTPRGALFCFLLGFYLSDEDVRAYVEKKKNIVFILCLLGAVLTIAFGMFGFQNHKVLIQPYHPWILMYSGCLFLLLEPNENIKSLGKTELIQTLSDLSLLIYIIHPVFINALYKGLHFFPGRFFPVIGEIIIWIIVSICSVITAILFNHIYEYRPIFICNKK